ncbi:MAG: glycerate kinase [Candidatus Elarobacter sp.]
MRVVVAPDKVKGCLTAAQVAHALIEGFSDVIPDARFVPVPMADGGDGTVAAFLEGGATARTVTVSGPLGAPVNATYARDGELAVIEMAAASGLALLDREHLDVRRATTRGTGELLRDALDSGATRIVLGIGGSATDDGGAGALAALGARFLDASGAELDPAPSSLQTLARIDLDGLDARLHSVRIEVACDVTEVLLGEHGASAVYAPQKGATEPGDVAFLDATLARLADAMEAATGRVLREKKGSGAAGGLGWALASACEAKLERGVKLVARVRGLKRALRDADLCLTGEGRIDGQTLSGKVVDGVARLARKRRVPVIAFGGSVEPDAESVLRERGVVCIPIVPGPLGLKAAITHAEANLRAAAARVAALLDTV